jgi:hypothetical protein
MLKMIGTLSSSRKTSEAAASAAPASASPRLAEGSGAYCATSGEGARTPGTYPGNRFVRRQQGASWIDD